MTKDMSAVLRTVVNGYVQDPTVRDIAKDTGLEMQQVRALLAGLIKLNYVEVRKGAGWEGQFYVATELGRRMS